MADISSTNVTCAFLYSSERKHEGGLDAIDDEDEETSEVQKVDAAVSLALASHQMDSHQMDNEHYFAPSSNSSAIDSSRLSTASLDPLGKECTASITQIVLTAVSCMCAGTSCTGDGNIAHTIQYSSNLIIILVE